MLEWSAGQIRCRLIDPDEFYPDSFRTKKIASGISIIVGKIEKNGPMVAQSIHFDAHKFNMSKAQTWIKNNWKGKLPDDYDVVVESEKKQKKNISRVPQKYSEVLNDKLAEKMGWSPEKYALIKEVIENAPEIVQNLLRECDLVGLNERVTYHKPAEQEEVPYTHIFENECILVKHRKLPMLIIYGPEIEYVDNFIEG